jgi:hypothetical protein
MEKTFFKKFLPLMIFMLFLIGLLGNVGEAQLSDEPPEAATTDLEWALIVDGAVNQPINLTFNDLSTMPRSMVNSVLYRMGSLVTLGDWVGVKLGYLLETAGFQSEANSLTFVASDGYEILLDLKDAFHENVIIAYELDGHPLSETLRLVIPWKNGNSWIAWITQITVGTAFVTTPANNSYLPPQLSQPPSMPNSTYKPQPSDHPIIPPVDISALQEIDLSTPNQFSQDQKLPTYNCIALVTLIMAIVAAMTANLYLNRKKKQITSV